MKKKGEYDTFSKVEPELRHKFELNLKKTQNSNVKRKVVLRISLKLQFKENNNLKL